MSRSKIVSSRIRCTAPRLGSLAVLGLTGLGLTVLGGCAVKAPEPVTVLDDLIPATWHASPEASVAEPVADSWWAAFGDPQLDALVREAQERSFDLRAAAAVVEQAVAQARIAGADRAPQASVGFDASRRQQIFVGLPIPGTDGVLASSSSSFGVSLNISWEADLWGRVRAGKAAADADVGGARLDLEAARLSIAAQTAKSYFALREANRQVRLAAETLANRTRTVERTTARYRRGVTPPVDVRLARTEQAQAESELHLRERVRTRVQRALEMLLGRYPAGLLEASDIDLPAPPPAIPSGLPADLITRRPDLAAAEQRLVAAGYRIAEARAALFPRLSLTGSTGTSSNALGDLVDSDFSVWNLAGNLLAPIFQGGRLRAAVELRAASRERSLAEYAGAVLRAFGEVETSLALASTLTAQEQSLEQARTEAQRAATLARDRYDAGLGGNGGFLQVLEADRRAFNAESQLVAVRVERLNNRIDLFVALGGGFTLDAPSDPSDAPPSTNTATSMATTEPATDSTSHASVDDVPVLNTPSGTAP